MSDPVAIGGFFTGLSVLLTGAYLDAKKRGRFSVAKGSLEKIQAGASGQTGMMLNAAVSAVAPLVFVIFPEDVRMKTKKRLVQAGLEKMEAEDFLAIKLVFLVASMLVVGFASILFGFPLILGIAAAGPGYVLPEAWLDSRLKKRKMEIERDSPDFAVLLSAVLSAGGVGVNEALKVVAEQIGGELGKEVNRTFAEIASGKRRGDALSALAERCGVQEINEVVRSVQTAERFGVPVAEALKDLAVQVYVLRRAKAEEKLGKAQVAVIFPMLMFFIMPLLGMLFYPALSQLSKILKT
ncbi:MAG TPA: type II secretion system F family protein [Bacillota bacterium]|nr:type II secretion system F family protein [Bacillota bacterium]